MYGPRPRTFKTEGTVFLYTDLRAVNNVYFKHTEISWLILNNNLLWGRETLQGVRMDDSQHYANTRLFWLDVENLLLALIGSEQKRRFGAAIVPSAHDCEPRLRGWQNYSLQGFSLHEFIGRYIKKTTAKMERWRSYLWIHWISDLALFQEFISQSGNSFYLRSKSSTAAPSLRCKSIKLSRTSSSIA